MPKNGSTVFGNLQGRKIVVLFTTKDAVPRQINPRIPSKALEEVKTTKVPSLFLFIAAKKETIIVSFR